MAKKQKAYIVNSASKGTPVDFGEVDPIVVVAKSRQEAINAAATFLSIRKKNDRVNLWISREKVDVLVASGTGVTHVKPNLIADAEEIVEAGIEKLISLDNGLSEILESLEAMEDEND